MRFYGTDSRPGDRKAAVLLYIHGMGGSADEAEHYVTLFPGCNVTGLDYQTFTPWETGAEIKKAVLTLKADYSRVYLIANSIGAFFSMNAGIETELDHAWFVSPIVDMEKLIMGMMAQAGVSEQGLQEKGTVHTAAGTDLSWEYLCYVRTHPIGWNVPTDVLYGSWDTLTSIETITSFVRTHRAALTVMEGGEHWFHTAEQMRFLDNWIKETSGETL